MDTGTGPTRAELLAAKDANALDRYWVAVTGDRVIDAGLSEVTVHKRRGRETGRSTSGPSSRARAANI